MRFFALARLSTCALLCLSPVLLGHCGGATNDGLMGTETGNPPVVDSQKLHLVSGALGPVLVGDAGAVPAGAEVRLDNRSTGDSATLTAGADGSFQLNIMGTVSDTYEVTVTHRGGSTTLTVSVAAPDAEDSGTNPSDLSCEQLENALGLQLSSAFAPFATGCTDDSQCGFSDWGLGCFYQCGYSSVLATRREEARGAAEQSIAPLCNELEQRACDRPRPFPCEVGYPIPVCFGGACQGANQLSCEDLGSAAGERASNLRALAERSCNVDADCVLTVLPALSCVASCGYPDVVAASAVAELRQQVAVIDSSFCGPFSERSCAPPLPLGCPLIPVMRAVCIENSCTIESGP